MAKCKLCGKEVDKNTAFKLSTRTYCCSLFYVEGQGQSSIPNLNL